MSGTENQVTWSAVCNLVEDPSSLPSPVVLHGPPGSGKSHLLGGISSELYKRHPTLEQRHFTADRLTRACQAAHYRRQPQALTAELQALEVLLVDDLDQLSRRKATQKLLCRALETIREQGGQVVLTAREQPRAIKGISPDLASRLHQGILIRVDPASVETRTVFLKRELIARDLRLPPPMQTEIATRLDNAAVLRSVCDVLAHLARGGHPPRRAMIEEVIAHHEQGHAVRSAGPCLPGICALVEQMRGLAPRSLQQPGGRSRAAARRMAIWIAHALGIERAELAAHFDLKPGSISAALRKARAELEADPALKAEAERWRETLR